MNLPVLVRMTGIGKRFGPVAVLRGVSLEIRAGEVHVLAGENGAGKSTLIKILGGVYTEYDGRVEIDGQVVRPRSPQEANELGVAVIFQELSLVPSMSVADNIFLGRAVTRAGFILDDEQEQEAEALLKQLGLPISVSANVEDLPIAQQQLVEIAKALAHEANVIVMDEPTSALNAPEVEKLFALIEDLKARGCGIVYITHKMEEIERIADRITVLRDGQFVGSAPAAELPAPKLVEWMVGASLEERHSRKAAAAGPERLRVGHFSVLPRAKRARPVVNDVSFSVRAGEILGVAGLQGSGASELFLGLFGGWQGGTSGSIHLNGEPVSIATPRDAIAHRIALLTNDRKATGLIMPLSIVANATLPILPRLSPGGWRRLAREEEATRAMGESLSLRAASIHQEVGALSGGNQQKVALAKWIETDPQVLLLDEPTRGIDIGAKREIYRVLDELAGRGIAILLITSELPELLALSDRILVMHRGSVTAEFTREQATASRILEAAMGRTEALPA
jgi:ABC-type sugar transport system ATPase subunit